MCPHLGIITIHVLGEEYPFMVYSSSYSFTDSGVLILTERLETSFGEFKHQLRAITLIEYNGIQKIKGRGLISSLKIKGITANAVCFYSCDSRESNRICMAIQKQYNIPLKDSTPN